MPEAASGILRQRGAATRCRTLEQLQASRRRAGIAGWTESSAGTTAKQNQIRHCYIHSDFCEKRHSDYGIYSATKDTVDVICILIFLFKC